MIPLTALTAVAVFLFGFFLFRIVTVATSAIETTQRAMNAMRDSTLNEEARETAVQKASIRLFKTFFSILLRTVLALITATIPILIADISGWATIEAVVAFLTRWDVILIISVIICVGWYLAKRFSK